MGSNSISELKIHHAKSEAEEKRHRHNKGGKWWHYFGVFGDVALTLLATPACYATGNYYIVRYPSCEYDNIATLSTHIRILAFICGVNNRYSSFYLYIRSSHFGH